MDKIIGFIGCGNMARAIIGGMIKSNLIIPEKIIGSAKSKATLEKIEELYKIRGTLDNKKVARESDYLFISVKPYMHEEILEEIKDEIKKRMHSYYNSSRN